MSEGNLSKKQREAIEREFREMFDHTSYLISEWGKEGSLTDKQRIRFRISLGMCETIEDIKKLLIRVRRNRKQKEEKPSSYFNDGLLSDLKAVYNELIFESEKQGLLEVVDANRAKKIAGHLNEIIEGIEQGSL